MVANDTVWDSICVVCHVFDDAKGCGEIRGDKGKVNSVVVFVWMLHPADI